MQEADAAAAAAARRWNAAPNTFLLETHSSGKWQVASRWRQAAGGKGQLPANGISMLVLGACSEFGNRRAQIEQKNCASGSVVLSHVSRAVTATAGRVKVCERESGARESLLQQPIL